VETARWLGGHRIKCVLGQAQPLPSHTSAAYTIDRFPRPENELRLHGATVGRVVVALNVSGPLKGPNQFGDMHLPEPCGIGELALAWAGAV
jgi:hypothetical protein